MSRLLTTLAALTLAAAPIAASAGDDIIKIEATGSVSEVTDRLEAAVGTAGATIFARVDHTAGAESVGMEMQDAQLLIFGNPKLGTPAMQADILAGLQLPLRVLVYDDGEGKTWLAYQDVDDMFDDLDIDDDAGFVKMMEGALKKLTETASGI
jgi:uncharacterized protein (DUF302 family)